MMKSTLAESKNSQKTEKSVRTYMHTGNIVNIYIQPIKDGQEIN